MFVIMPLHNTQGDDQQDLCGKNLVEADLYNSGPIKVLSPPRAAEQRPIARMARRPLLRLERLQRRAPGAFQASCPITFNYRTRAPHLIPSLIIAPLARFRLTCIARRAMYEARQ